MQKWEYMAVEVALEPWRPDKTAQVRTSRMPLVETILNEWGDAGWEVVGLQRHGLFGNAVFVLKRQRE
jgi:hypothetical protein